MRSISWQLALTVAMVTGCTDRCGRSRANMSPEQVVEAYLDKALNMKDASERDQLLGLTTGNLKAAIESASPETIKAAYVDKSYQLENYSVIERRDHTPRETAITFQLTYSELSPTIKEPADAPKVTTENTVSLVKESGVWLIRDVVGSKTAIDFPVSEESKITAKAGQLSSASDEEVESLPDEEEPEVPVP